jgi:phosphate:Na+ symporter
MTGDSASTSVFLIVTGLAGGLGLFLYGMKVLSDGLKHVAGDRTRAILGRLTNNRVVALAAGAFVTVVVQSSSATTVMLIGFVQAGLMRFTQTLGIILGADIGTTVTAQLIAFRLTDVALLVLAGGVATMLLGRQSRARDVGETLAGFGMLFLGMRIMSDAVAPLEESAAIASALTRLEHPLVGILVGAAITSVIQSSAAFAGILIALATRGLLSLEAGIPLLFGANIGTCVTAALASIGANRDAVRVAAAHIGFKVFGVLLFVWWIPQFADLVRWLSPHAAEGLTGAAARGAELPRQIANAHTAFNVVLALVALPFTGVAAAVIRRLVPDRAEGEEGPFRTRFLDATLVGTPALALNLAKAEVLRMGAIVTRMVERVIAPFAENDRSVLSALDRDEDEIDFLDARIGDYLTQISQRELNEARAAEVFQMMYTATELEQIADIVSKNLRPRADEWLGLGERFSEEGRGEIVEFHLKAVKQIARAMEAFDEVNLEKAQRLRKKFRKYREMEMDFMREHYERLRADVTETVRTTEVHKDLMEQFTRIAAHATNIGRVMIEWAAPPEPPRARLSPPSALPPPPRS